MTSPVSAPTSPTSPTSEYIYRVIQSYNPRHEGEIALTTGDVVADAKNLGNGWTLGRNVTRDTLGIFPSKYIRPMSDIHSMASTPPSGEVTPQGAATPSRAGGGGGVRAGASGGGSLGHREGGGQSGETDRRGGRIPAGKGGSLGGGGGGRGSGKPPAEARPTVPAKPKGKPRPPPRTTSHLRSPGGSPLAEGEEGLGAGAEAGQDDVEGGQLASLTDEGAPGRDQAGGGGVGGGGPHPLQQQPSHGRHASCETDLDPEFHPSDTEYGSLPSQKRGRYAPNNKPHMVVKPSQGGGGGSGGGNGGGGSGGGGGRGGRMDPMMRDSPVSHSEADSELDTPPAGYYPPPTYATPTTSNKFRTARPPGQLPLSHVAGPDVTNNVTDQEKACDHQHHHHHHPLHDGDPGGATLLDLPATHDRSTSPMTVAPANNAAYSQPRGGGGGGTEHRVTINPHPQTEIIPNCADLAADADNVTNDETLRQHLPSPPGGGGDRKEKFADIKKRYYRDYRTMECPAHLRGDHNAPARFKPILKNRHQKVGDSAAKGQHIYYQEQPEVHRSSKLILSMVAGLLIGGILFVWMYYNLGYGLWVALAVAAFLAVVSIVLFAASRMCRCVAGLLLPSVCTTRGRLAFLALITGMLLGGPVTNVYHNMAEVSRSLSCSAEQTYNQTMLLLEPFDAMMIQLNKTILRLQQSAFDVSMGLQPLDEGLDRVEMDIHNGKIQLMGTQKTCKIMVDTAFNSCASGIIGAQEQCLGVMGALGTVYHHARDVLDRINPDRWAPKHTLLLKKRQVLLGDGLEDVDLPDTERDICEPLDTVSVCQGLNDSNRLCQPSTWAGEAIQEAVNATQRAMHTLQGTLQFHVSSDPYYNTRANASRMLYTVQHHVQTAYTRSTVYFEFVISILIKIVPLAALLLVYVSYCHVKLYLSSDTYDNSYITEHFIALDQKRSTIAGDNLLPLKRYERNYLIDTTHADLSRPENGLYRIGLAVFSLHFLVSTTCYLFDYILYWILSLIETHARPTFDVTGRESLDLVVTGEGVIVDLLHVFLKGFHPGQWFGFTANTQACLPQPHQPSLVYLLVVILLYFVLLLTILLKAYVLRLRNGLAGFFYPERRKARIVHLYNVILNQRSRMPRLLHQRARLNHRERQVGEQVSFCHQMGARCPPCRIFLYKSSKCLVCGAAEDQSFRDCETEKCYGVYCAQCYSDLGNVCPLCLHGMDYSDEEDYEDLEDDLGPYHRTSKIYL